MSNRIICFVDLHSKENIYSYLCINFPSRLQDEFNALDLNDLSTFELFYFAHKDEVELKSFFVDKTYISFMMFFVSLFECKNPSFSAVLNDVLDSIYNALTPTQIDDILKAKKSDSIASCLEEITKELLYREDEGTSYLITKSNNLLKSIMESREFDNSRTYYDDILMQCAYDELNTIVENWIGESKEYEFFGSFKNSYEKYCKNNPYIVEKWNTNTSEIHVLESVLESMTKILATSIYSYEQYTDEMRANLFDLWILLVTTGYKVVFSSKFYKNLKHILPY